MKLNDLKSVELKAIEKPARVPVPPFANKDNLADRIFGAFCRINPELPCMEDSEFIKRVFLCIQSVNSNAKIPTGDLVKWAKTDKTVAEWRKWYAEEKDRKNEYNKAHKEERKAESEVRKEKYGFAIVNGEVDSLATGYALEPEGIFFGRGESPVNGYWKAATEPEDIVVNTNSKNLPVLLEVQPDGSRVEKSFNWKVQWDPEFHGGAKYKVKIGIPNSKGEIIKVMKSPDKAITFASVKKEGQEKKYQAGAKLGKSYDKILKQVKKDLSFGANVETATAVFLLFEKGIRIGSTTVTRNNTKGLLSLEWGKDVKRSGDKIKFDFYGKDSVRDISEIETEFAGVIESHWSKTGKIATSKEKIEEYVKAIAPEVKNFTPKLARTAVAAYTAQKALDDVTKELKVTKDSPEALKKLAFEEATMRVAKRLNHQKGVNKVVEKKRAEAMKASKDKLLERKLKVKEQIEAKKEKIAIAKKKGDKEKVELLKEQIKKAKAKLELAEMNLESKGRNQNFANSTCKNSYIDPEIVVEWAKEVDIPIEKIYSKAQIKNFSFAID